jgi:hypothetical protein
MCIIQDTSASPPTLFVLGSETQTLCPQKVEGWQREGSSHRVAVLCSMPPSSHKCFTNSRRLERGHTLGNAATSKQNSGSHDHWHSRKQHFLIPGVTRSRVEPRAARHPRQREKQRLGRALHTTIHQPPLSGKQAT